MAYFRVYTQIDMSKDIGNLDLNLDLVDYGNYGSDDAWYGTGQKGEKWDIQTQGTCLNDNGLIEYIGYFYDGKNLFSVWPNIATSVAEFGSLEQNSIQHILRFDDEIRGDKFGDKLYGFEGRDLIYGREGNDHINGGSGQDGLYGGSGNDKLIGGSSSDGLYGGSGNDRLYGGSGRDSLEGNSGKDVLYGGTSVDFLYGGSSNNKLWGQSGADFLTGQSGNDKLYGGSGNDRLVGGSGKDRLVGGTGKDRLEGGKGADKFVLQKGKGWDTITYFSKIDSFDVIGFNDSKVRAVKKSGDVYLYAGKKDLLAIVLDGNGMNSLL